MQKYSIPRHVWRAIYPVLIFLGLLFVVIIAARNAYSASLTIEATFSGDVPPDTDLIFEQTTAFITDNMMLLQLISNAIALLVFALMWYKIRTKLPKYENSKLSILAVALTVLCFAGFNYLLTAVFSIIDITRLFPSFEENTLANLHGSLAIRLVGSVFVAPIVEELLCRGIVFNRLTAWMPTWGAALVNSALFAVMHLELVLILSAFIGGLAFCVLYMRFRNLWIPIFGHVAFNLANVALFEIFSSMGIDEINDLYLLIPALLVMAVSITLLIKHTKPAVLIPEPEVEPETEPEPPTDGGNSGDGKPDEAVEFGTL